MFPTLLLVVYVIGFGRTVPHIVVKKILISNKRALKKPFHLTMFIEEGRTKRLVELIF
jgi:hypothetical protein